MISPILSPLGHTWIFDLDGTLLKHNGYKTENGDTVLPGVLDFIQKIPNTDMIIIITSRPEANRAQTEHFLKKTGIKYNHIIFDAPPGERILINDTKPSGLITAISIKGNRDTFPLKELKIDTSL